MAMGKKLKEESMKILIVDDETVSRKILQRKLERIGSCTAVDDSLKALALFDKAAKSEEPFNLITLDVSMPKMDGRQLLSMIRKKEKAMKIPKENRVKIIMVTSRMNVSTIKECIRLGCDGYISKPVNKYQLIGNLSHMGLIPADDIEKYDKKKHPQVVAEIIKRFYKEKIRLPVLPAIVNEIRKLMEQQDPSIEDLEQIVKKDIAISSKLVSIANSPLYQGVDMADNLNTALVRLGIKAIYGLIAALAVKELFKTKNKALNFLLEKLWMHSFACGCFGKRIAAELGIQNPETVFLMGVVHDIGKMLLLKFFAELDSGESFENMDIQIAIHEVHTTFGAVLLKKMKFSEEFIHIAEFHHWNDFSSDDEKELVIIHLSDDLACRTGFDFFSTEQADDKVEPVSLSRLQNMKSLEQLNLDPDKVMEIADEIKSMVKEAAQSF